MKRIIGFLIWLVLRLYTCRRRSFTFPAPDGSPYMTRWPIWTRDPWPSPEGKTGGEGWYLHRMVASDYERELHNHPAPLVAIPLRVGYFEERLDGRGGSQHQARNTRTILRGPLSFNVLDGASFHRVCLLPRKTQIVAGWATRVVEEHTAWSLCYIGPRRGRWGFLGPSGEVRQADHHDGNTGATVRRGSVR